MELKSDKVGRSDDSEAPALDAIPIEEDIAMEDMQVEHFNLSAAEAQKPAITAPRSHKRQSHGLKAPPGGSYRIPEQGQLQIIIKNQNKTAVKLFLVPYNLTGMEPGKKTFIRQRSYSAGSVIDNIPVANGTSSDRAVLRYLIHLHICCPSRGRYYLYKSIRVVFANRVPDGKENLRNELSFPEPRYSPYKPVRAMPPPPSLPGAAGSHAALATEKAYRRRSSGFAFTSHGVSQGFDAFGITHPPIPVATPSSNLSKSASSASLQPWSQQTAVASPGSEQAAKTVIRAREFKKTLDFKKLINIEHFPERHLEGEESSGNCSQGSAVHKPNSLQPKELGDGKTDYVDIAFSTEGDHASCEGLLSQRLRTLEVKKTPSID
ncbi:hypothetical protein SEPCBS119000_002217 [Sporothrix epigloea]|uniref:Atos-like C-terminal domain-containing protein n=1 Tax=Sporothrix epigloea TaxID=1892477 RepID=A0ABP0DG66_9PEZI